MSSLQENAVAIVAALALIALLAVIAAVYFARSVGKLRMAVEEWRGKGEVNAARISALDAELKGASERKLELEYALAEGKDALDKALATAAEERTALSEKLAAMDARGREERKAADEKLALLQSGREEMTAQFKALAQQVVREQGEDFKKTAEERLGMIVGPLKENLGKFEGEMRNAREDAIKERAALKQEITSLTERSALISKETQNLTKALRGDNKKQGTWGEAILERLLETSGLEEGREYTRQALSLDEDGRRYLPDVVINLPGSRELVIDSKVSLTAYEQAVNAETDAEYAAALDRHIVSLRNHIRGLSDKNYAAVTQGSLDYVIMFVPIEGALSEAIKAKDGLTEYALERQVMIATPTTLMMALRTIKVVWDVERRNSNAEDIASRAGAIYDKVVGFATDMEKVGKQLDAARSAHGDALNKLTSGRGNVLRQVEMLKTLGAKTNKSMPGSMGIEAEEE